MWAGSLGKVEEARFAEGTLALGRALSGNRARIVLERGASSIAVALQLWIDLALVGR